MHTRKLLAVSLCSVLGIACGIVTAFLLPGSAGSTAFADPLGIGVPLRNQPCTGQNLILVGWGDTASPLGAAVSNNPSAHYLRTDASCDTAWKHTGAARMYAAYLGPYPTRQDACAVRMTAAHKGDFVTRLAAGNTEFVQCGCYYAHTAMPVLTDGGEVTAVNGIWTRTLQQMLFDSHFLTEKHNTGIYDALTQVGVRKLQDVSALPQTGVMDSSTWLALQKTACSRYTS